MRPAVCLPASGCVLTEVTVPEALLRGYSGRPVDRPAGRGLVRTEIGWSRGRFRPLAEMQGAPRVDGAALVALPLLAEAHVHLDKTMTVGRTGFGDGTLSGAVGLVSAQAAGWTGADFLDRMTRAAEQACASGTAVLRTHVDTPGRPGSFPAWAAALDLRAAMAPRMQVQVVALGAIFRATAEGFDDRCREVAAAGAVLGAFVPPGPVDPAQLDAFLRGAARHGLDVDFHIDESLDPGPCNLAALAEAIARTGHDGRVVAGHCCMLSVLDAGARDRVLDLVAAAGLTVVALPETNRYLLDRQPGRTPLRRGVTPVQELRARGVPVALGTDNVGDAFNPFGSYDLLSLFRSAISTAHLDGDPGGWLGSITHVPACAMGGEGGRIRPGLPADLMLMTAQDWPDLLGRPPEDRLVLRGGLPQAAKVPQPLTEAIP